MTADQHVRLYIDQLLADFRTGFEPFVITVLKSTHGADWFTVLRNTPELRTPLDARDLQLDATALVRIILSHWDSTFGRVLSYTDRSQLHEIRTVRNRWAHQASVSLDDVDRLADNVIRLLTSIRAEHTYKVITQREEFRIQRYAPAAARRAWRTPVVWISAIVVGFICTLSVGYAVMAMRAVTPQEAQNNNSVVAPLPSTPESGGVDSGNPVPPTAATSKVRTVSATATTPPNPTFAASDAFPCQTGQVKGNARTMIFHPPEGMYYALTRNESVVCFDSVDGALAAGYRASKR